MPNIDEVKNEPPTGIDPFSSLMEDDALLTELMVRTDRLLVAYPVDSGMSIYSSRDDLRGLSRLMMSQ